MNARKLTFIAATVSCLSLFACEWTSPEVGSSTRALDTDAVDDLVLFAQNSIRIESSTEVLGGGVAVEETAGSPYPVSDVLADSARLSVGAFARIGGDAAAATTLFEYGSELRDSQDFDRIAACDAAFADGLVRGGVGHPMSTVPSFPGVPLVSPGTGVLVIPAGTTHTLLATTSIGTIHVETGATLTLGSGLHELQEISTGTAATIVALGGIDVRLSERLTLGANASFTATTGVSAGDVRVDVLGTNIPNVVDGQVRAVRLGDGSQSLMILTVPNGTVEVGANAAFDGAILARDILVGFGASVTFQDGRNPYEGDSPTAYDDRFAASEDMQLNLAAPGVAANDFDPNGDPITVELLTGTTNGTVAVDAAGAVTYDPNPNFSGSDQFTYRVSDGTYFSSTATVTLVVGGADDTPRIFSEPERHTFVGALWSYAVDIEDPDAGDVHIFAFDSTQPTGMTIDANTGLVEWVPAPADVGTRTVAVRVTDSTGLFDVQTRAIEVGATPDPDRMVIYAGESVRIDGDAIIKGHVAVAGTGSGNVLGTGWFGAARGSLAPGSFLVGDLIAESVAMEFGAWVDDVYTNTVVLDQSQQSGTTTAFPAMAALADTSSVSGLSGALVVSDGASVVLADGTAVATATVGIAGCIELEAGTHAFGSLFVQEGGCVVALGPVTVRVNRSLTIAEDAYLGPALGANLDAADINVEVHGDNGGSPDPWATPPAVSVGPRTMIRAGVRAPNGTLDLGQDTYVWGRFHAAHVNVRMGANVLFEAGPDAAFGGPPTILTTGPTSVNERSTYVYDVDAVDYDPGDVVTYRLIDPPMGMTITATSGLITWDTTGIVPDVYTPRVRAEDLAGNFDEELLDITVVDINDAPVIAAATVPDITLGGEPMSWSVPATDQDAGDTLTFSLVSGPDNLQVDANTGVVTFTPDASQVQTHTFEVRATDGGGLFAEREFSVTVLPNQPPVFQTVAVQSATEEVPYAYASRAIDPEGDAVTYQFTTDADGLEVDANSGLVTWTPTEAQSGQTFNVEIIATDDYGSTSQPYPITVIAVNDPPDLAPIPDGTATEDQPFTVTVTATDPDANDEPSFTLGGSSPGYALIDDQGVITWTPTNDDVGTVTFSVTVTDLAGASDAETFDVIVANVNDAPVIHATVPGLATEDAPWGFSVDAEDPDGDPLEFTHSAPEGMEIDASGTLSWTPTNDQVQTHAFSVTASDGTLSTTRTYEVVVQPVNDPPTLAFIPDAAVDQEEPFSHVAMGSDIDVGDNLIYSLDLYPSGMVIDSYLGTIDWLPNTAQSGDYDVIARVTDDAGASALRPFTVTVNDINQAPVFVSTNITTATENTQYSYTIRAIDADEDPVSYSFVTRPLGMTIDSSGGSGSAQILWVPSTAQAELGTADVTVRAIDGQGGVTDETFTITVSTVGATCTPGSTDPRCTAVAWAYGVRADGLPLGAVTVEETGPSGPRVYSTDLSSGLVTLAGDVAGTYEWLFTAQGHAPAYRTATLTEQNVTWVPVPRLAPLTDITGTVLTTGSTHFDVNGRVELTFAASAVSASAALEVGVLEGQVLPGHLPLGWSFAGGVWYEVGSTVNQGPTAIFTLPAPLPIGEDTLLLARWDTASRTWVAVADVVVPNPTALAPQATATLGTPGGYALLLVDNTVSAPAHPAAGQVVPADVSAPPAIDEFVVTTQVDPETQIADTDPIQVTALASVGVSHANAIPSGLIVPARLFERYVFPAGSDLEVPLLDLPVAVYRYPPSLGADRAATFRVRPRFLFDSAAGTDAHQRIVLMDALAFDGAPIGSAGGSVSRDGITLTAASGTLSGAALVRVTTIDPERVGLAGLEPELAFRMEWSGNTLSSGRFAMSAGAVTPNQSFVLARYEVSDGHSGWSPVERFQSDAAGQLTSIEPAGELPGIIGGGTYALFAVAAPVGVVRGVVEDGASNPLADVIVRVPGTPWLQRTSLPNAAFALVQAPGPVEVVAERLGTSETGFGTGTLADATSVVDLVVVVGLQAPRVVEVVPADGGTDVSVVTGVEVHFSEPLDPATVGTDALVLTDGQGVEIEGQLTLRPGDRVLAFYSTNPLAYGSTYSIQLATTITDLDATPLALPTGFSFTTEDAPAPVQGGPRLSSYAPGASNTPCEPYDPAQVAPDFDPTSDPAGVPGFDPTDPDLTCIIGGPGVADPSVPVILANDDQGNLSTVLSRSNGSFKGFLRARPEELIVATFVNANGTNIEVRLERQYLEDGRVAFYEAGGTLEVDNPLGGAPIEILIEPGTIRRRGILGVVAETAAAAEARVGVTPVGGTVLVGLDFSYEGDALREPFDVRFPMDTSYSRLPGQPEDHGYQLSEVRTVDIDGVPTIVYNTLDNLVYENGGLASHSPPYLSLGGSLLGGATMQFGYTQSYVVGLLLAELPTAAYGTVVACEASDVPCQTAVRQNRQSADAIAGGRPISGAIVSAGASAAGQVPMGGMVSISNRNGRFALSYPRFNGSHGLRARSNAHPGQEATGVLSTASQFAVHRNLLFVDEDGYDASDCTPTISVSHSPSYPAIHVAAGAPPENERATVTIRADHSQEQTTIRRVVVTSAIDSNGQDASSAIQPQLQSTTAVPPTGQEQVWHVSHSAAVTVELTIEAEADCGASSYPHRILIGHSDPGVAADAPAPSDVADTSPPRVIRSSPVAGAHGVSPLEVITLVFDEPIDHRVTTDTPSPFRLVRTGGGVHPTSPAVVRRGHGEAIDLFFGGLDPNTEYQLLVTQGVRDLAGVEHEQRPDLAGNQRFSMRFTTAARSLVTDFTDSRVHSPAGAAVHGGYAYIIDRAQNYMHVFDISNPKEPVRVDTTIPVPSVHMRALRIIDGFDYVRPRGSRPCGAPPSVWEDTTAVSAGPILGCLSRNRTLAVVMGGRVGLGVQRMGVIDITDLQHPEVIASQQVAPASSAVGQLHWSPPHLGYVTWSVSDPTSAEGGRSFTSVSVVNLQQLIFGDSMNEDDLLAMPLAGRSGVDQNEDGDFGDASDTLPLPQRFPVDFVGREREITIIDSTQSIVDYVLGPSGYVGAVLTDGRVVDVDGTPTAATLPNQYLTLAAPDETGSGVVTYPTLPRATAQVSAAPDEYFDAIAYLPGETIRLRTGPERGRVDAGVDQTGNYAVVAVRNAATQESVLQLIDLQDPRFPVMIASPTGVPIPRASGQSSRVSVHRIKKDPLTGRLVVVTSNDRVWVDIDRLTMTVTAGGQHPAIVGIESQLGTTHDADGSSDFGVQVLAGDRTVSFKGPRIEFIDFPSESAVVTPSTFASLGGTATAEKDRYDALFANASITPGLQMARVNAIGSIAPTIDSAAANHHVLVRAPGGSGATLELALEALDRGFRPVVHSGRGMAPVRAAAPASLMASTSEGYTSAAEVPQIRAHRLSSNKSSPYFNVYLSDPFVVVGEEIDPSEVAVGSPLRAGGRVVLHSRYGLRASLDPIETGSQAGILTPYASEPGPGHFVPGTSATISAHDVARVRGENPPPLSSSVTTPGTGGLVQMHSGELRQTWTDLTIPSARMPVVFQRTYAGQGQQTGVLGPKFTHNYTQSLTPVNAATTPGGDGHVPRVNSVVERCDPNGVKFDDGFGNIVCYTRLDDSQGIPAEYAQDPLMSDKGWLATGEVTDWYLPPPTIFTALVRFRTGEYARLTPSGTEYRYTRDGILTWIADRYTDNRHDLVYDGRRLRAVVDSSVAQTRRGLLFAYYVAPNDPEKSSHDIATSHNQMIDRLAKVCDLQTPTRCVEYKYESGAVVDEAGRLRRVDDIDVRSVRLNGRAGRRRIRYDWKANGGGISAISDEHGSTSSNQRPIFIDASNSQDEIVANTGGVRGATALDAPPAGAANQMGGNYQRTVSLADGSSHQVAMNGFGQPLSFQSTRAGAQHEPPSGIQNIVYDPTTHLVRQVHYVLGRRIVNTYEPPTVPLRSRGNVVRVDDIADARGGGTLTRTFQYDHRYNQPTQMIDANGDTTTFALTADFKEVATTNYPGNYQASRVWNAQTGLVESETDVDGITRTFEYTSGGFVQRVHEGNARTMQYTYGCSAGRRGHYCTRFNPAGGATETVSYDERDRVIEISNGQLVTQIGRDLAGRATETEHDPGAGPSYGETNVYAVDGFLESRTEAGLEINGSVNSQTWNYTPDPMRRLLRQTAPNGDQVEYTYDHSGRVRTRTFVGAYSEAYRYDAHGNPTEYSSSNGVVRELRTYDGHDRISTVQDAIGGVQSVQYDGNGFPVGLGYFDPSSGSGSGPQLMGVTRRVDVFGRPLSVTRSNATTLFAYHQTGGQLESTTTGPLGSVRTTQYDTAGRTVSDQLVAGGTTLFVTTPSYGLDPQGRMSSVTQMESGVDFGTSMSYDDTLALGGYVNMVWDAVGTPLVSHNQRADGRPLQTTVGGLLTSSYEWSALGEPLGETRPSGFEIERELDEYRRESGVGSPTALRSFAFDSGHRLTSITMRDLSTVTFGSFHPVHQLPQTMTMASAGSINSSYNDRGDLVSLTTVDGVYSETNTYVQDALGRPRRADIVNGASVELDYDLLGVNTTFTLTHSGGTYGRTILPRIDGTVERFTYTGSQQGGVQHVRDSAGRLESLTYAGSTMMSVSDYAMASAPGTVVLGNGVDRVDDYDQRRRLVSRTYVQGGNIVASFRYAYDSANREVARVDVHRAGRANLYSYDQERLGTANIGARPTVFGSLPTNGDFGVGDAHFTSVYAPVTFDDRLQEVVTQVPVGESTPEIAELYQGYDAMGHATLLDGVARTRDSLGNVTSMPSEQGTLALDYDVRSRLRQATRPDGSTVTYDYRADDALVGRTVTCAVGAADCVDSNRVYVYDGLLLLQEHEQGATPSLRAQYFYADEGDVPFAADLWNATTQQLERHYYVVDRMGSVVGLMDASGQVVERIDYTVFGYPQITEQDTAAPAVSSVRSDGSGRLELVFSEPVDPAVSGTPVPVSNGQVGIEVNDLTSHITVRDGQGATVAVTDVTVVSDPAHRYGTVYSLTTTPLAAGISYTVDVSAGAVQDAWANLSSAQAVTVTYAAAAGTLQATGTVAGSTAPAVLARSAVGNSIGFQAHLHDWDVDLVLARARVYDARSGMFLQRDPNGYEDSVNLYAGMRWDPVNLRDPTGMGVNLAAGGAGAVLGFGFSVALQLAQMHDGARTEFSLGEAFIGAGAGAAIGLTLGAATPEVAGAFALGSGTVGLAEAAKAEKAGHHATAAVHGIGALLSIFVGLNGVSGGTGPRPQFATANSVNLEAASSMAATNALAAFVGPQAASVLLAEKLGGDDGPGETPRFRATKATDREYQGFGWNKKQNFIEAEFEDGRLSLVYKSKGPDRLRTRGSDLLEKVFGHFGRSKIEAFDAHWPQHPPYNSNYNAYMKALKTMSPEDAAFSTPIGRYLQGQGFKKVHFSEGGDYSPLNYGPLPARFKLTFTR